MKQHVENLKVSGLKPKEAIAKGVAQMSLKSEKTELVQ